jgi:hypothetical protein
MRFERINGIVFLRMDELGIRWMATRSVRDAQTKEDKIY